MLGRGGYAMVLFVFLLFFFVFFSGGALAPSTYLGRNLQVLPKMWGMSSPGPLQGCSGCITPVILRSGYAFAWSMPSNPLQSLADLTWDFRRWRARLCLGNDGPHKGRARRARSLSLLRISYEGLGKVEARPGCDGAVRLPLALLHRQRART